jgi:hypothetical protein
MGLEYNSMLYMQEVAELKNLEFQKSRMSVRRKDLINMNSSLRYSESKLDPSSEGYKVLDLRVQQLEQMTQVLDAESARLDMQIQATNALLQSTHGMLSKQIPDSFTLLGKD